MECIFDKCELVNGLLIGTIASLIASGIAFTISVLKNKRKLRKKYGKAEGSYLGYGYSNDKKGIMLEDTPHSEAKITYLQDNHLRIELTETPNEGKYLWSGNIIMELENYGSITWNYEIYEGIKQGNKRHKFGFKRLIIKEDDKYVYIYLTEENLVDGEKFPKEVLVREKKSAST